MRKGRWLVAALAALLPCGAVLAEDAARQSLDDAWWTGPMLANSAATLPRGHVLAEPYLYDVTAPGRDGFGSLTYLLYGVTDRLTVGLVPVFGYNRVSGAPDSSGIGVGDVSVQAQYRLTRFREGSWLPTISLMLQETLPTGAYDRLDRASDGFGSGARTTTVQLNTQTYLWLPNGRIVRMRLNLARGFSRWARVEGDSVYGTPAGFGGRARPGDWWFVDAAWEYSLSRHWVLALDLTWRREQPTRVRGATAPGGVPFRVDGVRHTAYGIAPAIEYNWSATLGLLVGVRVIPGRQGGATTVTPAVALNYVH